MLRAAVWTQGKVVKGFGRGSKDLGIPTANFDDEVVSKVSSDMNTGIYYGWARVNNGPIYKMVMSVGWNPYYHNEKKSMETHIIHKFDEDFYDQWLRVGICGYIRPEKNFTSLGDLIAAIEDDIRIAKEKLEDDRLAQVKLEDFIAKDFQLPSQL